MSKVSQEKVDRLRAHIEEHIPNFEVVYKEDEGWYKAAWYLYVIWAFFRVIGWVAPAMRDKFDTRYCNGVYNKMVMTSRAKHEDWTNPKTFWLVLHEYRHMLDMKKHPIWMPLSYLLVLPSIFSMRAYWELRGYTGTMLGVYETHGTIPDVILDLNVAPFKGSMYFWMLPFPSYVRRKLEERREDILEGRITMDMEW